MCTTGWPQHLLPSFPKCECLVDTLRLFPNEWYHIWELRSGACIILSMIDPNCGKVDDYFLSVSLTDGYLCMIMVFVIVFLLIIAIWCLLISFIINSPLQFCIVWLVPVMITNLRSWEQMNNSHGGRLFLWELPSRRDNVGIILGESCVLLSTPP